MDINQAARMIEWLDEERRRDKATIATLEERLAQQQDTIAMLGKRINSMESDQTVIRSQMTPSSQNSEVVDQIRKEMMQLLENAEAKRLVAEREADRRTELVRDNVSRPVKDLVDRIDKVERQTSEIP